MVGLVGSLQRNTEVVGRRSNQDYTEQRKNKEIIRWLCEQINCEYVERGWFHIL